MEDDVDEGLEQDLEQDLERDKNPITHVFALMWICPEGDKATFAEVLLRALSE